MTVLFLSDTAIDQCVVALSKGELVALPTETVYGLAGDATNGQAVAAIFATKGRPQFNPLIAHVSDQAMAARYVEIDPLSKKLMDAYWPGPLTLVLPLKKGADIHPLTTAGLGTLAVRNPKGAFAHIVARFGRPLAAPSANRSGRLSPTNAENVKGDLGDRIALILDGGDCGVGVESTIVKVDGNDIYLLRPGGLAAEDIEQQTGKKLKRVDQRAAIEAPGMLQSHYAPHAKVRIHATELYDGEALLAFGATRIRGAEKAVQCLNLSEQGDVEEAAHHLFSYLKKLDESKPVSIAVEPVPMRGLGEAINDRLTRAAAPRDVENG